MIDRKARNTVLILGVLVLLGLWLRGPFVRSGAPYFYDEDEAHHYNRVVDMVKNGEFNPRYFLKPSLHFYLRMPVVAVGFLAAARAGEVSSVKEIVTRDPFGLGGYSFNAYPISILKWSRAYSVLWSLLVILITAALSKNVTGVSRIGALAGLLVAVSPPLVSDSAKIGVDGIVCALVPLATLLAVRMYQTPKFWSVALAGVCAGLAVSTKYNALPVVVLPIAALLLSETFSPLLIVAAICSPVIGFIAGTPFLFADLPLFLDHVAHEILHYGVVGDIPEHTAEPGLQQAWFYLEWFFQSALGAVAFIAMLFGIGRCLAERKRRLLLFLLFPALYFGLMISQRVNYTRNMLVMIPYLAIFAAFACDWMLEKTKRRYAAIAGAVLLALQPLYMAIQARAAAKAVPESRVEAALWLTTHAGEVQKTAVSGNLQFDRELSKLPGMVRMDLTKISYADLKAQGFGRVVTGQGFQFAPAEDPAALQPEVHFPGSTTLQRVVNNPEIRIYRIQ